ncbi:hypothetical protein [Longivirga aurantiaca]|uniref:PH domain-containing protein n=1 Tax=Longivirga aurantiaca TaxID=1837743 RepID=A0ABW1T099_9ACTN
MTDDPRRPKPLFRVFDRDPDRHRPVDGDYVQSAYIRLHRPGPWRTALVVVLAFTTAWASLAVVLAVTVARTFPAKLTVLAVAALPLMVLYLLTARILSVGVYANDRSLKQNRVRSAYECDWVDVVDVRRVVERVRVLGLGPRADGERMVVVMRDGDEIATTITTHSPDFFLRSEAFDQAALAVERWWQQGRAA